MYTYKLILILHVIGATIWTGGHLALALGILPGALRQRSVVPVQAFESVYERIGLPALLVQIGTGVWLLHRLFPSHTAWVDVSSPSGQLIVLKFVLLAAGDVWMNGRPLRDRSLRERAKARAVLPQETALSFPLPVFEVVLMGRSPHLRGVESAHDRGIAREALRLVEAGHLAQRGYTTLPGGERQRVQLARVLAQVWENGDAARQPRYLLLDEPTAALDLAHQNAVLESSNRTFACPAPGAGV